MQMRKFLLLLFACVITATSLFAQVTTGSLTGTVNDSKGGLPGATVVATHVPSGTVYTTVTRATGQFTLPNMRVGGPYTVKISFIGYNDQTFNDLNVTLGTPVSLDVTLEDNSRQLSEVSITGSKKGAAISSERNGASTRVSLQALQSLPTLSRSLQDFTRLTPQAIATTSNSDGSPLGISFAGQNNRYNQFTIDGANASDAFGLAGAGTNGGQSGINPVPLESIQEVQILLSPYDVTQGGFTGGGINAVTKSGTNTFHGSAYYTYQNQDLVGKSYLTGDKYATFSNKTFGASLGGPIVKNKLFFYANYERFDNITPVAFDPSISTSGSKFDVNTLQQIRDYMQTTYNYDIGDFKAINKSIYSNSAFARLDWNINNKNKLTVRHSYVEGANFNISRSPTSITFTSGGYYFRNKTNSTVLELNSTTSANTSNVLRLTYTSVRDARETSPLSNVQINSAGLTYNFGADFSSSANSLDQNNFTLTDNFTIYKNNHTITFGTTNEFINTNNVFMQAYSGAYTYNKANTDNIAAFEANNAPPQQYTLTYNPSDPGNKFGAKISAAQLAIYGQDVWTVNPDFKLTYGLRIDMPVYFNRPEANPTFNSAGYFGGIQNNQVPKSKPLFSPRVGFNWNVDGVSETQVRGGLGLFTGRVPFVWVSNQYGGTGISTIRYTSPIPTTLRYTYNPSAPLNGAYIPPSNSFPASEVDVTDPNFKVPQTLRANLAVDQKLPFWGLVGTLEGIYTKVINNILYKQLNIGPVTATPSTIGGSSRPYYNFVRVDTRFTDVLMLTNTNAGYAYNITAQIQKPLSRGWTGSIAYTFGESFSLNDGLSSTATSNWRAINENGLNNLYQTRSNFDPGSRVIGNVSKTFTYANKRMSTTIGLVYIGQSGQPYSYVYNRNINGDDVTNRNSTSSFYAVEYIPSAAEFADPNGYTKYQLVNINGGATAAQQWIDFANFVEGNPNIKAYQGKVIPRNGIRLPWENHIDVKIAQDFNLVNQHKLQVALDVLNVGNMINKNWGLSYGTTNQNVSPLQAQSNGTQPTFTFDQTRLNLIKGVLRPYFINDLLSRWRAQVSVKYSF
ncbi:TonB-dependent receptor [Mucilaginibacter puniceus]